MAYKMAPKGGNNAKTGHGIPMTFRQDGPKQMEFIKNVGSKISEVGSNIGSAISRANDAGQKAYDNSRTATSYWGGSGRRDDYEKNPVDYVKGFVGNIMSGEETKPKAKVTPKSKGPHQETKPKVKPKVTPKKEKGFLDTVSDYASSAVNTVKGALKAGDDLVNKAKGSLDDSRMATNNDTMFGVQLSGRNAGSYDPTKNPLSSEYKKGPKQIKAKKKAPAKMKKC